MFKMIKLSIKKMIKNHLKNHYNKNIVFKMNKKIKNMN